MRYLFTCLLFLSFTADSAAQAFVGFRTGATRHFSTEYSSEDAMAYLSGKSTPETRWDKEIFGRYCFGRFCLEMSVNHYKKSTKYEHGYINPYAAPPIVPREIKTSGLYVDNDVIISSTLQYNTNTWGKKKQWRNYLGLSINQIYEHNTSCQVIIEDGITQPEESSVYHDTQLWPGISHSLSWDVNNQIQISTMAFFRYSFNNYNSPFSPNSLAGMQIGASYRVSR